MTGGGHSLDRPAMAIVQPTAAQLLKDDTGVVLLRPYTDTAPAQQPTNTHCGDVMLTQASSLPIDKSV